jgi:hypothetical protein
MRNYLIIFLMCLLPLQSFAVGMAASKMGNMTASAEQAATPCHDEASPAQTKHDGCCKNSVSCAAVCQAMCGVFTGLIPAVALPHLPVTSEDKPLGLSISYISAALAQPVKPPIF